jgi:hypothetical protein
MMDAMLAYGLAIYSSLWMIEVTLDSTQLRFIALRGSSYRWTKDRAKPVDTFPQKTSGIFYNSF